MTMPRTYEPKPKFVERMQNLLDDKEDLNRFLECAKTRPKKSIRVNALKITPEKLTKELENRGWEFKKFEGHPEILRIESNLMPGELGTTKEHILGYYYVQEITSMMPILALDPKEDEFLLDLCAAPGSKTTQAAVKMQNSGTIIANDISLGRITILSSNLERQGIMNTIITRHKGQETCAKLKNLNFEFDKILVDAPCSGEGNIRNSPKTYLEWSEGLLKSLSRKQKRLIQDSFDILKIGGIMVYSTCTHAPEENEIVVNHLLENNSNAKILEIENLPIKTRPGIISWKEKELNPELKKAKRIYHHDNDMEGFFLCKIQKTK